MTNEEKRRFWRLGMKEQKIIELIRMVDPRVYIRLREYFEDGGRKRSGSVEIFVPHNLTTDTI